MRAVRCQSTTKDGALVLRVITGELRLANVFFLNMATREPSNVYQLQSGNRVMSAHGDNKDPVHER